jgi:hypothetical protein
VTRRQKAIGFFVALCVLLVIAALLLNIGWVITNAGRITPIIVGIILFGLIIAGLIVYTVFLVLEIKRNEEHDSFINAVTHELKTPIASIRLYLETLQSREVSEVRRREFYDIMLADADRLHHTVDQVLKAGVVRERQKAVARGPVDVGALADECVGLAVVRHHLHPGAIELDAPRDRALVVSGDAEELRTRRHQPARQRREVLGKPGAGDGVCRRHRPRTPSGFAFRIAASGFRESSSSGFSIASIVSRREACATSRERASASISCGRSLVRTADGCSHKARARGAAPRSRSNCLD